MMNASPVPEAPCKPKSIHHQDPFTQIPQSQNTYIRQFLLQVARRQRCRHCRSIRRHQCGPFGDARIERGRCLETDHREHHHTGEHRCAAVRHRHQDRIAIAIIVGRIVRAERDQAAEGQTQREEDLRAGLQPDDRLEEHVPARRKQMPDTVHGT